MPKINIDIDEDVFLPCYRHLLDKSTFFDIDFLYGGRDSGKSRQIAMMAVIECLSAKYFKCLLIRKVLNTVRDSQYNLIKSIIEDWGLKQYFKYNDTRLEIICIYNGNGFFGRGLDDVGRIKSFNNPSHCWIEEGNQIDSEDFVVILTSLRANQRVKTWFSFNPECEMTYTEFWLYQDWFSHSTALSWTWTKSISVNDKVYSYEARATHTTYKDNPYCSPQRIALYEGYKLSKNNAYWYQTYTLGMWGYKITGGAFWKCFDRGKHVRDLGGYKGGAIFATVDNNVHPYITIGLWQVNHTTKTLKQIGELPCTSPNNTALKAAAALSEWLLKVDFVDKLIIVGDPSANAKSTVDDEGKSFFEKFINKIQKDGWIYENKVKKKNPSVAVSGSFINEIYESNYKGWSILIDTNCHKSIEDYVMTKEASDGTVLKKRETDDETKITYERYGHFTDTKRYLITMVLEAEYKEFAASRSKLWGIAA